MKYSESETAELKEKLTDDLIKEIIAFLNSYLGGTIYIGVDNNENIKKISNQEKDLIESKIINWIRDEAIYPNCSEFVSIKYNIDDLVEVKINLVIINHII